MNEVWLALRISLQVSSIAMIFVVIIGGAIAYLLANFKFPGRNFLDTLVTLPLVLPPTVIGFYLLLVFGRNGILGRPIYNLTGWNLVFTWQGAVLAATVVALPLTIKTTKAALESVNPIYLKAAYTLGQSPLETLIRVWLPLAWKGILAGMVLSFARTLGEFGATLIIAGNIPGETQTLAIAIYDAIQANNDDLTTILVVILTLISVSVLLLVNYLEKSK